MARRRGGILGSLSLGLLSVERASHRAAQRPSAETRHFKRHLTLHGTLHRHRQHHRHGPAFPTPAFPKWATIKGAPWHIICFHGHCWTSWILLPPFSQKIVAADRECDASGLLKVSALGLPMLLLHRLTWLGSTITPGTTIATKCPTCT